MRRKLFIFFTLILICQISCNGKELFPTIDRGPSSKEAKGRVELIDWEGSYQSKVGKKYHRCFKKVSTEKSFVYFKNNMPSNQLLPFADPLHAEQRVFESKYFVKSGESTLGFRVIIFSPLPSVGTCSRILDGWEKMGLIRKANLPLTCGQYYFGNDMVGKKPDKTSSIFFCADNNDLFVEFSYGHSLYGYESEHINIFKEACSCINQAID